MRVPPVALVVVCVLWTACGGASRATRPATTPPQGADLPGTLHTVQPGDTLWSLAARYHSTVDELAEVNGLHQEDVLGVGQVLFIPAPDPMAPPPPPGGEPAATGRGPAPPAPPAAARFAWPLGQGVLFSGFGPRQGAPHDGIDLGAPEGTPVLAAADGVVIFSGSRGAFGNLVIVQHAEDNVTVYAHNRRNLAREGDRVRRGQTIAEVGTSGNAQTPHVHFEIRVQRKPVDPEPLLPADPP